MINELSIYKITFNVKRWYPKFCDYRVTKRSLRVLAINTVAAVSEGPKYCRGRRYIYDKHISCTKLDSMAIE